MPRRSGPSAVSRRDFLRLSALAAAAGMTLPALLSACATGSAVPQVAAARALLANASPEHPVSLPIYDDNPPIPHGLPLEDGATLRVFQFKEYLSPDVLASFEKRHEDHGISVETTSYDTIDEALGIIAQPGSDFDVFFPSVETLGPLVQQRMLRPLSHIYLHNCGNLWDQFTGTGEPFFDADMRYSTPYTVYTTGVEWRDDLVKPADAPPALDDPYGALWNPAYAGKVAIYDSPREALGLAMVRNGFTDLNHAGDGEIEAAADDLLKMKDLVGLKLVGEGTFEGLVEGEQAVRQAWSGDAISARRYAKDEHSPTERAAADHIRYQWQPGGIVGVDLTAILAQGQHPVAAHAFLDHLMDEEVAMRNFAWNGYQPATKGSVPKNFLPGAKWSSIVGPGLANAIVSPEQWAKGVVLMELKPEDETRWLRAWDNVRSAAEA